MSQKITLEVSAEAADAFETSSPEERRSLSKIVEMYLVQRRSNLEEFRQLAKRIGSYASARGLTEEELDNLLADES